MSDNIKRNLEGTREQMAEQIKKDIEKDILEDAKESRAIDLEPETIEVPLYSPNYGIHEEEIPSEPLSWSTGSSSPAEAMSSRGYENGGSTPVSQRDESGLKGGPLPTYGDVAGGNGGTGENPTGEDGESGAVGDGYDDSPAGNGYNKNRTANQNRQNKQEDNPEDKENPNGDGDKKKGQTGAAETRTEDSDGDVDTSKLKSDLEKEDKKDKEEEEAIDKAATKATIANGDPNQGAQPNDASKTGSQEGEQPEKKAAQDETGNGYGALDKKKQPAQNDSNDATARARRNLEHQNRVNNGDSKPVGEAKKKSSSAKKTGSPVKDALANAGNKLKNKAKNLGKKKDGTSKNSDSKGSEVVDKGIGAIKNALLLFMKSHPVLSIGIILVILLLIIFMIDTMEFNAGGRGRGKRSCTYTLNGVTSTGTVELSNLKVEIINCDGKADNYEVLDTVDFEKYILGVALAEAGPSSPDEALKAQMIAVRNFTLTRNSGMCPSHPESCFHGYNESTGIIRMRACTNDQVYWDYTKDCPKIERAGQPTLYCEGVDGSTDIWKKALSEERQKEVEALANEVMGEVLLDENGNVLKLGYQADETDKFIADANAGKSYVEILEGVYGSSSYSSAKCTYGGVFDYGDYTLSSENTSILHEPLDEFLEDNGTSLEEFNELIADNVDDAGWGTRAGVVAAAVTLIGELGDNYGVKVPYYWGGGHYDGVVDGALGYWGSTQCHTYANNQHYNYCGFDCSGFVPWAIKNGGFKKGVDLASNFQNMPNARRVKLTNQPELQPGDLLESDGHIVLVVGIDEASGQYICAEAMGNAYGVLFTRRAFNESGYWGVDLEDYYNDPNYIREPIR